MPGVAEALDFASALVAREFDRLDETTVRATVSTVVKDSEDRERITRRLLGVNHFVELVAELRARGLAPGPDRVATAVVALMVLPEQALSGHSLDALRKLVEVISR